MRALTVLAALLMFGCEAPSPAQSSFPLPPMEEGWSIWAVPVPVLWLNGTTHVQMSCKPITLKVQVLGLEPAQAFPQPDLKMTIGSAAWTATPVASMAGEVAALDVDIFLNQNMMRARDTLSSLRAGSKISIEFDGRSVTLPDLPRDVGAEFAEACVKRLDIPPELWEPRAPR